MRAWSDPRQNASVVYEIGVLGSDRPELQFTSKELSRTMGEPTVYGEEAMKGVCRFLVAHPRVVWRCPRQSIPTHATGRRDSSWVGCPVTEIIDVFAYIAWSPPDILGRIDADHYWVVQRGVRVLWECPCSLQVTGSTESIPRPRV